MSDARDRSRWCWYELQAQWMRTRESWHDSTTEHFASQFWEPLEVEIIAYRRALDDLISVLAEAYGISQEQC